MLEASETLAYVKLAKNGDSEAKEILLKNNTSLLKSIIKRFVKRGVEYDDLYQLASLGFIKAIANFDDSYNVCFSTYAVPMIIGEIKRYLRDDGSVKVSRLIKTLSYKINAYTEELKKSGESSPNIKKISEHFEVSEEDVVLAMGALKPVVSLFEKLDNDSDKPVELVDRLPSKEHEDDIVDRIMLRQIIDELPEREKKVILLRYYRDKTQSEIAQELGVSQVQVSRMETRIVNKLKVKM